MKIRRTKITLKTREIHFVRRTAEERTGAEETPKVCPFCQHPLNSNLLSASASSAVLMVSEEKTAELITAAADCDNPETNYSAETD